MARGQSGTYLKLPKIILHMTFSSEIQSDLDTLYLKYPHIKNNFQQKFELMIEKILDWNSKVNIISRKDIDSLIPNHIIPSLSLLQIKSFEDNETVIDIGTGGGFPGLPLAVLHPKVQFTLLGNYVNGNITLRRLLFQS
jgi:16S rRNA G527 N7-methylase RsmG